MSRVLPAFDPSAVPSGTFDTTFGASGTGTLIGHNLSPYELILDFGNGNRKLLPAWSGRRYDLCVPTPSVSYAVDATPNQSGPPLSLVYFEAYPQDEQINEQYPVAYTRQTSIGNQVSTTSSNTLINDGAALGTQIIEMTPQGYAQSFYVLKNDGTLTLYAVSNGVVTELLSVTPGTASTPAQVVLGSTSNGATTAVHGTADNATNATNASSVPASGVTGTLPASQVGSGYPGSYVSGAVSSANSAGTATNAYNLIDNSTLAGPHIKDYGSNTYGIQGGTSSQVELVGVNSSGVANLAVRGATDGSVLLANAKVTISQYGAIVPVNGGALTGQHNFSGTGPGTYSHGLGATPSFVGVTSNEANSTETVGVDSIGSTSVHVNAPQTTWPLVMTATTS